VGTMAMSRRGRPASGVVGEQWHQAKRGCVSMLRGSFMILIGNLTDARPCGYRFARPGDAL